MTTYEAQCLAFAQSHDWGQGAYLDAGRICGLVESWSHRNPVTGEITFWDQVESVPATLRDLRDFGGY